MMQNLTNFPVFRLRVVLVLLTELEFSMTINCVYCGYKVTSAAYLHMDMNRMFFSLMWYRFASAAKNISI
jgi:hypothetical protein